MQCLYKESRKHTLPKAHYTFKNVFKIFQFITVVNCLVLFCVENNGYAMGTAVKRSSAETEFHRRGTAFRIPGMDVNGMDVLEVRNVHGLTDTVLAFPMGPDGDVTHPMALWARVFGCGPAAADREVVGPKGSRLERYVWQDCAKGRRIRLDVHGSGHFIPKGWFARQLDELLGREPRLP